MTRRLLLMLPLVGFLVLMLFLYLGLGLNPFHRESKLVQDARQFPAFELSTLEDPERRVDESVMRGEVTLVNVWGEWCPECKREMPQLLDLADRGVRLVGVNWKDTREKGRGFLAEFGDPFAVNVFDPEGDLAFELGVYGAPESFLVDADGVIRYHHTGYISPSDLRDTILPEVEKWQ
ncbi:DsbE family thiol:disulfide interchange protein [Halomonas sp. NO4]|uniref:DsbE family thiol:disulfide interchange protein n=1 Tax=Halomonas sp. NO4 TaxID=2484813 RepID=UPI0013D52049|nr:DsbE family thiol:disulfide interchange protein [Halomonas sp. NO4]